MKSRPDVLCQKQLQGALNLLQPSKLLEQVHAQCQRL